LGVSLSGAGPSVSVFLDPAVAVSKTRKSIATRLAANGLRAELLLTSIASRGGRS
jgi:homoserine kinase